MYKLSRINIYDLAMKMHQHSGPGYTLSARGRVWKDNHIINKAPGCAQPGHCPVYKLYPPHSFNGMVNLSGFLKLNIQRCYVYDDIAMYIIDCMGKRTFLCVY